MTQNRRQFISAIAAAGAAIPFSGAFDQYYAPEDTPGKFPVRLFSKPIDNYDFSFMCECLLRSGINGFDLTVRQGGKVEPLKVETDLPKLADEAKKFNLAIDMMVTGILASTDPFTEMVLRTAAATGVTHYRLGWFDYDTKAGISESLQKYNAALKEIALLNKKYKIHGDYQNHSGQRVGGPVWDIHELLHGIDPEYVGCQYDVRHATVEGANTWILGMQLISASIKSLAIKDFTWRSENGRPQAVTVPLGEGMINWDIYFKAVRDLRIEGPVTLHVEYPLLEKGEERLSLSQQQDIIVGKLKKDVDFLKRYLYKYELA